MKAPVKPAAYHLPWALPWHLLARSSMLETPWSFFYRCPVMATDTHYDWTHGSLI